MRTILMRRRNGARRALALSIALIAWSFSGCASSSSSDTKASVPESSSASSQRPLNLVIVGDSIPNAAYECPACDGFPDQYGRALGEEPVEKSSPTTCPSTMA